jgi:hypothetical protein
MTETRSAQDTSLLGNGSARRTEDTPAAENMLLLSHYCQYLWEVFFFVLLDLSVTFDPARETAPTCPAVGGFCGLGLLGKG